ncbi:MAG TPA: TFIIB-type zinc ribbon-containing protein, partial [Methanomassiliicoccales archaeon]|nr:TFIIB-type zinc ribbon-containing protein [Methanomassiliicoccales archaeon]
MKQRLPIYACPNCGGRDLVPKVLVGGPMAQLDENTGAYHCQECGRTAVPLSFNRVEEWISFRQQAMKRSEEEREKTGFLSIPILPVDTIPLLTIAGIDLPIAKTVEVVSIAWSGEKLERTDYHVVFERYWAAVAGKRYNATEVLMLDLAG